MNILVGYTSLEGQSRKIADVVSKQLQQEGHDTRLYDVLANAGKQFADWDQTGAMIVISSVHIGHYPAELVDFISSNIGKIAQFPSAFISVSMAAASQSDSAQDDIRTIAKGFLERCHWGPNMVHHAAGALKYTQYGFIKRWVMKRISQKEGGAQDTSRDHDYTDWVALGKFVDLFASTLKEKAK